MLRSGSFLSRKSHHDDSHWTGRGPRKLSLQALERRTMLTAAPFNPGFDSGCWAAELESAAGEYAQGFSQFSYLTGDYFASFAASGVQASVASQYSSTTEVGGDSHYAFARYDFSFAFLAAFNNLPIAEAGGPYAIVEGEPLTLDASASSDPDGDPLAYSWDLNADGVFDDAVGVDPTIEWSQLDALGMGDDGVYSIAVQVDDGFGGVGVATTTIEVGNVAPKAEILGAPETSPEGTPISLDSVIADPGTADTHSYLWSVAKDGEAYQSGDVESFEFTPDDNSSYEVTLTVTDDDGGVGVATTTIEVGNVAPQLEDVSVPELIDEGGTLTLGAAIVDPASQDAFKLDVDWGDGTTESFSYPAGTTGVNESHAYQSGGVYTINLALADDDGGSTSATATAMVSGVGVQDGVLQVVGSDGNDQAIVAALPGERYVVSANFLCDPWQPRIVEAAGIERVDMILHDGNDVGLIAANVTIPTLVDGGKGDDQLMGGSGHDVLLGGDGRDVLLGALGRNLLIGGAESDIVVGNSQDILIGGSTAFDAHTEALFSLMDEWSSGRDVQARASNLAGTGGADRANGDFFLGAAGSEDPSATVFDDGARDLLIGSAAHDWFFAASGEGPDADDWVIDFRLGRV